MGFSVRTRSVAAGAAALVALGVGGVAVATVNPMSPVGRQSTSEPSDPAPGDDATTTAPDEGPTTDEPATEGPADEAPAPDGPADEAPPPADEPPPPVDAPGGDDHEGHGPGGHEGHHGPGRLAGVLDRLVADGVITQEQADAIRDALAEAHGPGHRPGPGAFGGPGLDLDALWDAAAEITGLPADALREGLEEGRSLAEIAEDEGVGRQALVDALVAEATGHLDAAVDAGWLTRERADAFAEGVRDHVEHLVDLRGPHR